MAYRLEADEPLASGIKRIILECIDQAAHDLVDPSVDRDVGVHEARKGFKRIRAALRLVRDEIGATVYMRENACYRDCGRQLAPLRDSFVMVEMLDDLAADPATQCIGDACAGLRQTLMDRYQATYRQVLDEGTAVEEVRAALQEARTRTLGLPIDQEDFSAVRKGLWRIYKQGCYGMARAYADPTPENFHEWRKGVKDLWYHHQILEPLWPWLLSTVAVALHDLSEYLGDDHDLAVLRHALVDDPALQCDDGALLTLVELIDKRRAMLEETARPLGARLYAEQPKAFIKRMAAYASAVAAARGTEGYGEAGMVARLNETALRLSDGVLLSTGQAAERLGLHPRQVRALIGSGALPAVKVNRSWIIKADDLSRTGVVANGRRGEG